MKPVITDNFINKENEEFPKVRQVAFQSGNLSNNVGIFITETKYEPTNWFNSSNNLTNGVFIYQSYNNPNVAYRIYKCFADYGFNGYDDDILIQELQKKQELINDTKFPTGVVTLDGNIIGQEIPFFNNNITLLDFFKKYKNIDIVNEYIKVLNVLKEMYDNGILYVDVHSENFMLDPTLIHSKINTIDFERKFVMVDDWSKSARERLFSCFSNMINQLNNIREVDLKLGRFVLTNNFDDTYEELEEMTKKLVK